ncbi:hypothetical protein [Bifidobacterium vansinderenii]|uniref:Uncharacterized protein n=1 Tax=Bifidobacterium vansinderenii TaxID=1984871 RepID=A0A229VXT8_9BIFI|nr:hypothetical protein [Bifidobacterium vansinderenii]OXN00433.1 hypothetical protein Tam10B_1303 [Bifidobacterium vansinderenii]
MLGMVIVVQLRKWVALHRDVELTASDVDELISIVDDADDSLGMLDTLRVAAEEAGTRAGSGLALLLTHADPADKPFEVRGELADDDAGSLAAGFYSRLNAAMNGYDGTVERDAIRVHLTGEDGEAYGREVLLTVLQDIADLAYAQQQMEQQGRMRSAGDKGTWTGDEASK